VSCSKKWNNMEQGKRRTALRSVAAPAATPAEGREAQAVGTV
jgi:hypothetical protein